MARCKDGRRQQPGEEQTVGERDLRITNCHIHTFTADHVPDRFAGIFGELLRFRPLRVGVLAFLRAFGRKPRSLFARYATILEVSHLGSQKKIFERARSFYPQGTRFVVVATACCSLEREKAREGVGQRRRDHPHLGRDPAPGERGPGTPDVRAQQ